MVTLARPSGPLEQSLRPFGTEPLALSGTASGPLEQSLRPFGTRAALLERPPALARPPGYWNSPSGFWTARSATG